MTGNITTPTRERRGATQISPLPLRADCNRIVVVSGGFVVSSKQNPGKAPGLALLDAAGFAPTPSSRDSFFSGNKNRLSWPHPISPGKVALVNGQNQVAARESMNNSCLFTPTSLNVFTNGTSSSALALASMTGTFWPKL